MLEHKANKIAGILCAGKSVDKQRGGQALAPVSR
jgi:hypothetical protein